VGISTLWDFLSIGLAGLEIFCGGDSQAWGFPEDWISMLRDILRRGFAFLSVSLVLDY